MKIRLLLNSILYAVALAMGIAIIVLSFFMDFSCAVNTRYFIVFLAIGIFSLALAGINSINKEQSD